MYEAICMKKTLIPLISGVEESTTSVEDATPEKVEETQAEASPESDEFDSESESDESESSDQDPAEVEKAESEEAAEPNEDDLEGAFPSPTRLLCTNFACHLCHLSFKNITAACIFLCSSI